MLDPVALGMIETKEWPVPYISICAPSISPKHHDAPFSGTVEEGSVLYSGVH